MFINREMRSALLISFLWHFFWMSFVEIVFLPSGFKPRQYASAYFLGSILRSPISIGGTPADKKGFDLPFEIDTQMNKANFGQSPYPLLSTERKTINADSFIDVDAPRNERFSELSFAAATGSANKRKVIYKPKFHKYPEWIQQEIKAAGTIFKIYISGSGLVEQVINMQASGNPEIDAALARYIERWRFAPVSGKQGQWQTVKIGMDFDSSTALTINPQQSRGIE